MTGRRTLALSFIGLNLADLLLTHLALAHGAMEMNPLMRWGFTHGWGDLYKLAVTFGIGAVLLCWGRPAVARLGWLLTGFYLAVVACNVMVLFS